MGRPLALAVMMLGLTGASAAYLLVASQPTDNEVVIPTRPVWTEAKWPFPIDQWGMGRAFKCKPTDCGVEVNIYLRAKLGACNCDTGVADDADLDRMSDFDLLGGEVSPLGVGRPITIAVMKGRSRAYMLADRNGQGKSAMSVAFNDRCDMVVATAVIASDRPGAQEPAVLEFLNGDLVLRWAEATLGL